MAPPESLSSPQTGKAGQVPAVLLFAEISVLKKRRDFLAAARARRRVTPGFVIQARKRAEDETSPTPVRIGYTCSKKVGNAVARNRAKRRLREAVRAAAPGHARQSWDYVLIGRNAVTSARAFEDMVSDLKTAFQQLHAK